MLVVWGLEESEFSAILVSPLSTCLVNINCGVGEGLAAVVGRQYSFLNRLVVNSLELIPEGKSQKGLD